MDYKPNYFFHQAGGLYFTVQQRGKQTTILPTNCLCLKGITVIVKWPEKEKLKLTEDAFLVQIEMKVIKFQN